MNIADLKRARDAGATHEYKGNYLNLNNEHFVRLPCGSPNVIDINNAHLYEEFGVKKIDYGPLTDYQQDKALDIAVTGISE